MRVSTTRILMFIVPLLLAGCFGDAGTDQNPYNGTWTATYNNLADYPVDTATLVSSCSRPNATITLVDGSGSTSQTLTCTITTLDATTYAVIKTVTHVIIYEISVAISGTGTVNAIVSGYPHTGTCVSTSGCSALAGAAALSLTR